MRAIIPTITLVIPVLCSAQWSITSINQTHSITFDNSVSGVLNSAYIGNGLSPQPSIGQLNSNAFKIVGLSDGDSNFGDTLASADFSRGYAINAVSTGGMYAFNYGTAEDSNMSIGFQATTADMSPGKLVLRMQNNSGKTIARVSLNYDLLIRNNGARSSSIKTCYSWTDSSYYLLNESLRYSTPALDSLAEWQIETIALDVHGLQWLDGEYFYLSWSLDDNSGSGDRDEIAFDNISITPYQLLALQDFENSSNDNWELIQTSTLASNNLGVTDAPPSTRICFGDYSMQLTNKLDSLTLENIEISAYSNLKLFINLSASTTNPSNGLDALDYCKVYLSLNDSDFHSTPFLEINGKSNCYWSYLGNENNNHDPKQVSNIFSTTILAPNGGGLRDDDGDGVSQIVVTIPEGYQNLGLKIKSLCNAEEYWNIDNIQLSGVANSCSYSPISNLEVSQENFNAIRVNFTKGSAVKTIAILREHSPVSTYPIAGISYENSGNLKTAPSLSNFEDHLIVYNGVDSAFNISQLNAGSRYYLSLFSYNDTSCYDPSPITSNFVACAGKSLAIKEGFDEGLNLSEHWISENISTYSTTANAGKATPSLKLDNSLAQLTTPELCYYSNAISLWLKGNGTDINSALIIEGLDSLNEWNLVDTITSLPTASLDGYNRYLGSEKAGGYRKFRFSYLKSAGNLALDDIVIYGANPEGFSFSFTNASGDSLWTNANNWSPLYTQPGNSDTLLISDGNSYHIKGFVSQSFNAIILENGSSLFLSADSLNQELILNALDSNALSICSTCTLGLEGNVPIKIQLLNNHTLKINGQVSTAGSAAHQILSYREKGLKFQDGSSLNLLASDDSQGNLGFFGSTLQSENSVLFKNGSSFIAGGINSPNPFVLDEPKAIVQFEEESNFYFAETSGNPDFENRRYGNFYYYQNQTSNISAGSIGPSFNQLHVETGILKFTGDFDISVSAGLSVSGDSLIFNPSSTQDLIINGDSCVLDNSNNRLSLGENLRVKIDSGSCYQTGPIILKSALEINGGNYVVQEGDSLTCLDSIINNGTFILANNASLLQGSQSQIFGSGNCQLTRHIPNTSNATLYHFWSSPMQLGDGATIGPTGVLNGSLRYAFNPGGNEAADYQYISTNEQMPPGKGYAVAGISSATFNGVFSNGDINIAATETDGQESYNLIGNPYPSAINAEKFLTENASVLDGTIYLWSSTGEDQGNSSKQYISVNSLGSSSITDRAATSSNTYIASCQGFFVETLESLSEGDYSLSFNNSMRFGSNSFFKSNKKANSKSWIYLARDKGDTLSCLLVIDDGASLKYDSGKDAKSLNSEEGISFYQQGLSLNILALPPIANTLLIPMHISVTASGNYSLGGLNGYFPYRNGYKPYLIDSETNIALDIYEEESVDIYLDKGIYKDRFKLLFSRQNSPTDLEEIGFTSYAFRILNKDIKFQKSNPPSYVEILDVNGRTLFSSSYEDFYTEISNKLKANHLYLVMVKFSDKTKVIFKHLEQPD